MKDSFSLQSSIGLIVTGFVLGWGTHTVLQLLASKAPSTSNINGASHSQSLPTAVSPAGTKGDDTLEEEPPASKRTWKRGECKMVLVVNTDLKMGTGKVAAQCCHAAVAAYQGGMKRFPDLTRDWDRYGCAKIALKCESVDKMHDIARVAEERGLNFYVVEDAGRTQIPAGSHTVCAIGPHENHVIDELTGPKGLFPLKLY